MYFLRERFFEGALSNNFEIYFFKEQFWKYSWNVFFENVFFLTTKNIWKKKSKKKLQKKLKKELKKNEKIEKKNFFLKKKIEKEKENQRIKIFKKSWKKKEKKTCLGETGCFSNLTGCSRIQFFISASFLEHNQLTHVWYPTTHSAVLV